ncbi:uncharacterized protein JCM10292_005600, partial [Rhodotorula paludigena]|uniref:uncharacterized protein n=1 Tax=Rhodotorula paludigena TaxID=86838 RepID=UPI00316B9E70
TIRNANSWFPTGPRAKESDSWQRVGPWFQLFYNARRWTIRNANSWFPTGPRAKESDSWQRVGPWFQLFYNARRWVG